MGRDCPEAEKAAEEHRRNALALAIIRALAPGSGRSSLCSEDELIERLDQAVVIYDPADVPAALSLMEAGELRGQFYRLRLPQPLRQPSAFGTAERGPGLSRIDRQVIGARAMIGMLPSAELTTPGPVGTVATLSPIVIVVMILIGKTVLLGLLIAMITALLDDHKRLPGVGFGISSGLGESGEESGAEPRCISDTGSASSH